MSIATIILINVALDGAIVAAAAYMCARAARLAPHVPDGAAERRGLVATITPSTTARRPAAAQWRLRGQSADARV